MRFVLAAAVAVSCALGCAPAEKKGAAAADVPLFTPRWAFEPWISKDISTGDDMQEFIAGFQERDIPVGVAVLDSPWETNYNTFIPNEGRYPGFAQMVADWRAEGIRTVLWTTQMVNESSFDIEQGGDSYDGAAANFIDGEDHHYFVNDGDTYLWWKGTGAAVDFFNKDARAWWHAQQRSLLDAGVAGFKLDFGEQYVTGDTIDTAAGKKTLQEYSEAYYRDFLENGVRTAGTQEFVIMPRPYDESYGFAPRFYARPGDAPVTWVGDQHRDWGGMQDALDHIFHSAQAGYAVMGSDIGGYLDERSGQSLPFDAEVFWRWTAMSALTPLFQLHGRANLAPWTVPGDATVVDETVAQYRYWATLHHALTPFFFSAVREAQLQTPARARANEGAVPVLHVVGDGPEQWANDYRFFAGDAFFVAPLLAPGAARDVALPVRDDGAGYVDWWDLGGDALAGGTTVSFTAPADDAARRMPLYVVEGAIVPMVVDSDALAPLAPLAPEDPRAFADALTVLCFPGPSPTSFTVHADDDSTGTVSVDGGAVTLDGVSGRVILRVRMADPASRSVELDGAVVPAAAALDELGGGAAARFDDVAGRAVWVSVPDGTAAALSVR